MFEETDVSIFEEFTDEELVCFNAYLDRVQSKLFTKNEENYCVFAIIVSCSNCFPAFRLLHRQALSRSTYAAEATGDVGCRG